MIGHGIDFCLSNYFEERFYFEVNITPKKYPHSFPISQFYPSTFPAIKVYTYTYI